MLATTVSSIGDLEAKLSTAVTGSLTATPEAQPVVLVFGGQESDFVGISENLYRSCKVFRQNVDAVDALVVTSGQDSILPAVFQREPPSRLVSLHTALFAVQYASAKSWMDCGLRVDAVIGHSFGQLTALCISGVLSLSDAVKLVSGRALLMQEHWGLEPGSMLALQTDRKTVQELLAKLDDTLYAEIACYNGPKSHVVVGAIDALQKDISDSPRLCASFTHPLLSHLAALAGELEWKRPAIHLETTDELESIAEPDFSIVAGHTRLPVFFQNAVQRLTEKFHRCTWIEAGRGDSVLQLVKASITNTQGHVFHSPPLTSTAAEHALVDITVDLWNRGYSTQYWPFHRSEKCMYGDLDLPSIQFDKTRYWLGFQRRATEKADGEAALQLLGGHVMGGQTLAPASLYFEVVAHAALFLQGDSKAEFHVLVVDDLHMQTPIGQDVNTKVFLVLKRLHDSERLAWSFSFKTQPCEAPNAEPFEVSTGRVCLRLRNDKQQARDFERYESLTGHRRYEQVVHHPEADKMQGRHIYRAFNTVVFYDKPFHGIKEVASVGFEAAGKVRAMPSPDDPADQRLVDTPMIDSFMQFAGFLVNYFNNPSSEDVFVCGKIEHIELGGNFDPDAGEWLVYATMGEGGETDAWSDAYIFDARTKKMVMAAFGFRFSRISRTLLGRILKNVNKSANATESTAQVDNLVPVKHTRSAALASRANQPAGKKRELLKVLSNVTDVPVEDIGDESTLDDLGIDSLMATEVLNDIRAALGLTIDLSIFLFTPNIAALTLLVNEKLGTCEDSDADSGISGVSGVSRNSDAGPETPSKDESSQPKSPILSARDAFDETRLNYDQHAKTTGAVGFWQYAYPSQARLVQAYIIEAFAALGCDLRTLAAGDEVLPVKSLSKHAQLTLQFHRALEDGGLIIAHTNGSFARTARDIDPTPAEQIYQDSIFHHPQHASVLKLVRAVGSELAACLSGNKEGIQVVFGNRDTKKTLEEMYEFWPLLRTPTLVLGDFLEKASRNVAGHRKFRILEIGAGTGGTARYLLQHLRNLHIDFEYVFTDLGASLVNAASKSFKGHEAGGDLAFDVLDIEKEPNIEYKGRFDGVIATNCIHATRDLGVSLRHARQMLRDDGALALVEITQNMYWLDVVSDGTCPEAATVRVIAAFPGTDGDELAVVPERQVKAAIETVVYKTIGDMDIHADIYYPLEGEQVLWGRKLPVALMIHGGSHMLFSRKDVRPAQTRLLLNRGFLPVSIDHRLCPEVGLQDGPMVDVCDAYDWARNTLSKIRLPNPGLQVDGEKVFVVGWSSGGQLAMSLGWTAPQRGLPPPVAMIVFYAPTDYEDAWWQSPIEPNGAPYQGQQYDVLEGVRDKPISQYDTVVAWEELLTYPRNLLDARCRIVMHINWKAQTLPVILNGLPSKKRALAAFAEEQDWGKLPQPPLDVIRAASPRAHIRNGSFKVPTFFVHGTADDLIPWEQAAGTHRTMSELGLESEMVLVDGAPHICDLSSDPKSDGWKAVLRAYNFLASHI
ncbi:polyketide synthase [Grosmannia clavigera kw1407]|uniref:Polyketide synthase n=1 Tax=Grosmannia clavigera (strain kw1407 / UAMH 11150) TaxID=655863 RepID=F0XAS0_GROCL|nr:polyketide synthase [Grosmannia clavigera kw1407]EFX05534.1 polyketide synthase [Grosmannia clavigera kw1407]